jgi:hypothetical protein
MGSIAFPLQGLFNFLVFIRPKYAEVRKCDPNLPCIGAVGKADWNPTGSRPASYTPSIKARESSKPLSGGKSQIVDRDGDLNSTAEYVADDCHDNRSAKTAPTHVHEAEQMFYNMSRLCEAGNLSPASSLHGSVVDVNDDIDADSGITTWVNTMNVTRQNETMQQDSLTSQKANCNSVVNKIGAVLIKNKTSTDPVPPNSDFETVVITFEQTKESTDERESLFPP